MYTKERPELCCDRKDRLFESKHRSNITLAFKVPFCGNGRFAEDAMCLVGPKRTSMGGGDSHLS